MGKIARSPIYREAIEKLLSENAYSEDVIKHKKLNKEALQITIDEINKFNLFGKVTATLKSKKLIEKCFKEACAKKLQQTDAIVKEIKCPDDLVSIRKELNIIPPENCSVLLKKRQSSPKKKSTEKSDSSKIFEILLDIQQKLKILERTKELEEKECLKKLNTLESSFKVQSVSPPLQNVDPNSTLGPFDLTSHNISLGGIETLRAPIRNNELKSREVRMIDSKQLEYKKRSFSCSTFDCEFQLPEFSINLINKNENEKLIFILREEYKKFNNSCVLCFRNIQHRRKFLVGYAYCKSPVCVTFKFLINENKIVKVYVSGTPQHTRGEAIIGQVRGIERKIVKEDLKSISAFRYRQKRLLEASEDIASTGNMQGIKNLATFRKMKSEKNFDNYADPDPFVEVYFMYKGAYKGYIQRVTAPLEIFLWEPLTFETLITYPQILIDCSFTFHIDASGESIKKIEAAEKRVYVYKIVIHIKKHKIILTIAEAFMSRHSSKDIEGFLHAIKLYCKEKKIKWPLVKRFCCDVSFAIINAILNIYNNQSVIDYLHACFRVVTDNQSRRLNFVVVQFCKCHYAKIIANDMNHRVSNNLLLRNLLKRSLLHSFELDSLEAAISLFRNIFYVLLLPTTNQQFRSSYAILNNRDFHPEEKIAYSIFEEEGEKYFESIAKSSPFRNFFLDIKEKIKLDIDSELYSGEQNHFRNEALCDFIINKYCSLLPFWINIMGCIVDPINGAVSNAPVENRFLIQKHYVLPRANLRPGEFIKLTRESNGSILKEVRILYRLFDLNNKVEQKSHELSECLNDHDYSKNSFCDVPEEGWSKKNQLKRNAISGKTLASIKNIKNAESYQFLVNEVKLRNSFQAFQKKFYLFSYKQLFEEVGHTPKEVIGFNFFLDIQDFLLLQVGEWLSTFILDICIASIIKNNDNKNVNSLPCLDGIHNLYFSDLNIFHNKQIIIPIIKNAHFTVAIADFSKQTFLFFDPQGLRDGRDIFLSFLSAIKENKASLWKLSTPNCQRQQDNSSCGLFVIYYVRQFLNNASFFDLSSLTDFVRELRNLIIKFKDPSRCCYRCAKNNILKKCTNCPFSCCTTCILKYYKKRFSQCSICKMGIFGGKK